MTQELKACPFCGYAIFEDHEEATSADTEAICCVFNASGWTESHYLECPRCEAQGPKADCAEDAAEGWRTRTPDPADLRSQRDELLEALEEAADALRYQPYRNTRTLQTIPHLDALITRIRGEGK